VAGPGVALQRWLRLRIDPALVLPLGLAYAAAAAWLGIASGRGWIFPLLILAADLGLAWPAHRRSWGLASGPPLRGALAPLIAVVGVLALLQYPLNRRTAEGDFRLDDLERIDTAFHVGVTWELVAGYPPQVPGLAGVPLSYHVGPHLIRAEAYKWAGIHPYDALYRFDVTLWALALVLALRGAARAAGAGAFAVALAGWTPLATDFSFLFGWLDPALHWWTELLRGNLLLSLVFANSVVPALAMAAGVVVAMERFRSDGARGWLLVAGALAAAVPFFKIFLAGQLLLGLLVAVILGAAWRPIAAVAAPCALGVAALAASPGSHAVQVLFDPLSPAAKAREMLAWPAISGAALAGWAVLWLLASLGLRALGIPEAVRALRRTPASAVLAAMALSGWPLTLLFRITADGVFDEGVYLSVESGALLWIFTAMGVAYLAGRGRRRWAVCAAAAVLSLPSTIELVEGKAAVPPDLVPARVLRAMAALQHDGRLGDVVLMRPFSRFPPPPIVFVGRRVPFTHYMPYMQQFATASEIRDREAEVREFFRTDDAERALRIAQRLGARHAYLYGPQSIAPAVEARLEPLYVEGGLRLYRIPQAPPRAGDSTPRSPRR
jgi:hypothetical protein